MDSDEIFYHLPVFKDEAIKFLVWKENGIYVDGTLGGGGHTESILKKISSNGKLIAIDQDEDAINFSKTRLLKYKNDIIFEKNNFSNIKNILQKYSINKIDGILLDLGISSFQIDNEERGFSFMKNSALDMRMDKNQVLRAEDILNNYSADELKKIFYEYGEVNEARQIVNLIVKSREKSKLENSTSLKEIIEKNFKGPNVNKLLAKIFQSLRIAVNNELVSLEKCLNDVFEFLNPNGRIVVISYHSLEDRIVKKFFNSKVNPKIDVNYFSKSNKGIAELKLITKKAMVPSENEILVNNRARSAKLRVAEKI